MKRVLPIFEFFMSSFHRLLCGVTSYAMQNRDWHLDLIYESRYKLPNRWRGDGILSQMLPIDRMERFLERHKGIPVVAFTGDLDPRFNLSVVKEDNDEIGRIAARYFLSTGHRSFCWYGIAGRDRGVAFASALSQAGIGKVHCIPPCRVRSKVTEWILNHLRKRPLPCAIFCENDVWARELLDAALEGGFSVPEQISILGVDNEPTICESSGIPISSIDNRLEAVGYEASALLDRIMDGAPPPSSPILIKPVPYPVVRKSSDALFSKDFLSKAAIEFMRANHHLKISVEDVAKAINVSDSGLRKRFAKSLGESPKEVLINMRLETACRMLRKTPMKLSDVAESSGFGDYKLLNGAFKRKMGISPSKYRSELKA